MAGGKKQETSSTEVAALASKVLNTGKATAKEVMTLAGSVLTNAADKPKPAAKSTKAKK